MTNRGLCIALLRHGRDRNHDNASRRRCRHQCRHRTSTTQYVISQSSDNQFDALKLLVERGANLDVVDSNDRSLLSIVALRGMGERFVILLLDAGAPTRWSVELAP
jgi:ankyrin repeat protein